MVGHTIAVGIFLTPAELIGALAAPALTLSVWFVCGAAVFAGALTFGELAARYPHAGGPYVYLREGWGDRIAFLYGWQSLLVMDPGVTAALAAGIAQYAVLLWPQAGAAEKLCAVIAVWAVTLPSMAGLRFSARILTLLTALKLLALGGIVIAAFTFGNGEWSNLTPFAERRPGARPLLEALALGLVGAFFSFGGFWEASRVAGDVRDPGRTLPLALGIGTICVTLVYVLTSLAFMYLGPFDATTSAADFGRRAGEAMLGSIGPSILAVAVLLSAVPSAMALIVMAPRVYVAMNRDGLFPSSLAAVRGDGRTPARAMVVLATLATIFVLLGTFQQIVAFFLCTTLTFVALAASALFVVRRRGAESPFLVPAYPLAPALFVALVLTVVVLVAMALPVQALAGFGLVLLGLPVRYLVGMRARR